MSDAETVWRQYEANEVTHSAAHYLLAVSELAESGESPRAADVARRLEVSRAAVSLQLKSLREQGLVQVGHDRHVHLTPEGADLVARIASKRRVLQVFFQDVLGVEEGIALLDACKMEHLEASSGALVRLLRFLRSGHPAAEECMEAFSRVIERCPPGRRCDLCTEVCLLSAAHDD